MMTTTHATPAKLAIRNVSRYSDDITERCVRYAFGTVVSVPGRLRNMPQFYGTDKAKLAATKLAKVRRRIRAYERVIAAAERN
jgi:hypothetical protein